MFSFSSSIHRSKNNIKPQFSHSINLKSCLIAAFFILFVIGWYHSVFEFPFYGDAYKLQSANQLENSYTIEYWIKRLLTLTNGPQYRPISFFFTPFLFRHFFGVSTYPYFLFGIVLIGLACFQVYKLILYILCSRFAASVISIIFVSHPAHYLLMRNTSNIEKYFVPLNIFIFGLNIVVSRKNISWKKASLLTLFMVIAILSHEASIFFPIPLVGIYWLIHKKIISPILLTILPSGIYALARIFVWGVPYTGGMAVKFESIFSNLPYYTYITWAPIFNQPLVDINDYSVKVGSGILLVWAGFALIATYRSKNIGHFWGLIVSCCVVFPYSILADHVIMSRASWDIVGACVSLAFFYKFLKVNVRYRWLVDTILSGVLVVTLGFSYDVVSNQREWAVKVFEAHKELKSHVRDQLNSFPNQKVFKVKYPYDIWEWKADSVIPGFLALYFSDSTFLITGESLKSKMKSVLVYQGAYYFRFSSSDNGYWMSPYNDSVNINVPDMETVPVIQLDKGLVERFR